MPQMGLHICAGLEVGRRLPVSRAVRAGLLAGSILPDLDFIPLIALRPFDRELAISFHRNLTHSALAACTLAAVGLVLGLMLGRRAVSHLGVGLAVGMLLHAFLDILMWFGTVHLTWPWGEPIDVYGAFEPPPWVRNLLLAFEPVAYVLALLYLRHVGQVTMPRGYKPHIAVLLAASLALFVLVPVVPRTSFEILAYGLAIPLGFIPIIGVLVVVRRQLFG